MTRIPKSTPLSKQNEITSNRTRIQAILNHMCMVKTKQIFWRVEFGTFTQTRNAHIVDLKS